MVNKAAQKGTQTMKTNTEFDPHQYAIDMGWDFTQIAATADLGVSSADAEGLTESQQENLRAWCKQQVTPLAP